MKVVGNGKGGRNQEIALSVAAALAQRDGDVALGSVGTDGIDGPTDAAGAYADTTTIARAQQRALDADAYLADNNAYAFFQSLGDLDHHRSVHDERRRYCRSFCSADSTRIRLYSH